MRLKFSPARLLSQLLILCLVIGVAHQGGAVDCRDLSRSPDRLERLSDFPVLSPSARQSLASGPKAVTTWESRRRQGKPVLALAISSFNLAMKEVETIENYLHYEHRALWNILRARDPNVRVLFVSSDPVPKEAIDHMLESLPPKKGALYVHGLILSMLVIVATFT